MCCLEMLDRSNRPVHCLEMLDRSNRPVHCLEMLDRSNRPVHCLEMLDRSNRPVHCLEMLDRSNRPVHWLQVCARVIYIGQPFLSVVYIRRYIVKACLVGGLQPRLARVNRQNNTIYTRDAENLEFHNDSVLNIIGPGKEPNSLIIIIGPGKEPNSLIIIIGPSKEPNSLIIIIEPGKEPNSINIIGPGKEPNSINIIGPSREPNSLNIIGPGKEPNSLNIIGRGKEPSSVHFFVIISLILPGYHFCTSLCHNILVIDIFLGQETKSQIQKDSVNRLASDWIVYDELKPDSKDKVKLGLYPSCIVVTSMLYRSYMYVISLLYRSLNVRILSAVTTLLHGC